MKSTKNGIIPNDFMGEFDRSMKPSNIIENTAMRYSAAYPMGRERIVIRKEIVQVTINSKGSKGKS